MSKPRNYEWRSGFHTRGADATACNSEIEAIRKKLGKVTARDVVDYAKDNKESECHKPIFHFSDKKAADEFRLNIARNLMNSIRIRPRDDGPPRRVNVAIRQPGSGERHYERVSAIRSADKIHELKQQAASDLRGWCLRYKDLSEHFPNEFELMEDIINEISEGW